MRVDSHAHAGDSVLARWAVLLANGSKCQAAGCHEDERKYITLADLSVPEAKLLTV